MSYAYRFGLALFQPLACLRKAVWGLGGFGAALVLCLGLQTLPAHADDGDDQPSLRVETGRYSGLPLPRFVSIKSSKANMRIGPGEDYTVKWVYQRRHLPVEVIGEYDLWRQVRDRDGDEGWIHSALLDGRRYGVIQGENIVFTKRPGNTDNVVVAKVDANVVVRLLACSPGWCRVEAQKVKGWVERKHIWGLYDDEIFE